MVNRHDGAVGPLSINGRMFIQGEDTIMAYDAYNGLFLWKRSNPETIRTGVFFNNSPGNLVASDDSLYYMSGDKCFRLDAETGKTVATYNLPEGMQEKHQWGYIDYQDGKIFGTATIREEIEKKLRRRGKAAVDNTDAIFAIDVNTGKLAWVYQGKSIQHQTIAIGPDQVYFIDSSITSEQRADILRQDKSDLQNLTGKEREIAEDRAKKIDLRLAVAVDIKDGKQAWATPVDVTDCSEIGIGGGRLTLMYHNDKLLLCGANANGHYWQQFMAGNFSRRRLVALSAKDGYKIWSKDGNYRHRPIIVGDQVLAEPWSYDLATGDQKMRKHPLTGEEVPWSIMRSGHHCGMISAAPNMLMFRSGYTGFYDLKTDSGTRHFAGHRTGCWINAIVANGLVMIPESSAGCVCLFSISSTIVLEPREPRNDWSIISSVGKVSPVKNMALNLGAPGDRRSASGTVWLSYPRPRPSRATSLDLPLDIKPKFESSDKYNSVNTRANSIKETETGWLYTSQAIGLSRCELPLIGKDEQAGVYNVRLHFAELDENVKEAGQRLFDVSIQGKTVLSAVDVYAESGGLRTALVKELSGVVVTDNLVIELTSQSQSDKKSLPPILNAVEVIRVSEGK
ncbi:MAG: PQQ-binding-like beta-propeller repeat protein [Planctomycetaceae bacterium]|nr:PQQ-binding-like beta-propeller repeat protein [Planctomycetaceae bacterium]